MILDTNALTAVADDEPAAVLVYRQTASIESPVIVLGEYLFGIGQSPHRMRQRLSRMIVVADASPLYKQTNFHDSPDLIEVAQS